MFDDITNHNFNLYMPISLYQELPTPKDIGISGDFLTIPCTGNESPHMNLKNNGMKILIPGQIYYDIENPLPDDSPSDPLRQIIECYGGEDYVFGVLNIDEPVRGGDYTTKYLNRSYEIYERVKTISPQIPVFQTFAPIVGVVGMEERSITMEEIENIMELIRLFVPNRADYIGFDIYPIPDNLGKLVTPYNNETFIDASNGGISAYINWMKYEFPEMKRYIALQGFGSYENLAEPGYFGVDIRYPTENEVKEMLQSVIYDVDVVVWWGQSYINSTIGDEYWEMVLDVTMEYTNSGNSRVICFWALMFVILL